MSEKNERVRTSSPFCDARFMLIFIVREKRQKLFTERESLARKRSNNIPFVFYQEKCGFYCDAKMSEWNNKGRGAKEDRYTLHPKRLFTKN